MHVDLTLRIGDWVTSNITSVEDIINVPAMLARLFVCSHPWRDQLILSQVWCRSAMDQLRQLNAADEPQAAAAVFRAVVVVFGGNRVLLAVDVCRTVRSCAMLMLPVVEEVRVRFFTVRKNPVLVMMSSRRLS